MKCLNDTGLQHLIEKIRTEMQQLKARLDAVGSKEPIAATWSEVQTIVREGRAAEEFSLGDQFVCNHSELGEILWDVVGIDTDTAADGSAHTLTLQTHNLLPAHTFDATEAICLAPDNLPPGNYCFKLTDGYREEDGGGQYLSFISEQEIFSSDMIVFNWPQGQPADQGTVEICSGPLSVAPQATYSVFFGQSGTELTGLRHSSYTEGNSLWNESALWKYLNLKGWDYSTVYDRAHTEFPKDFQEGLDEDFLAVLGKIRVLEQDVSKNDASYSEELFTLPSYCNVNGGPGPCEYDTVTYPYYGEDEAGTGEQIKRIKTLNGAAADYFLRSPAPDGYGKVYCVSASGSISSVTANSTLGIAPICCIM